jgi:hypothetical protein
VAARCSRHRRPVPAEVQADRNRFSISATTRWRLSATLHLKTHLDQILVSVISRRHEPTRADDGCHAPQPRARLHNFWVPWPALVDDLQHSNLRHRLTSRSLATTRQSGRPC